MPTTLQQDFIWAQKPKRFGVPDTDARRTRKRAANTHYASIAMTFSALCLITGPIDWSPLFIPAQAPQEKRLRDENGRIEDSDDDYPILRL